MSVNAPTLTLEEAARLPYPSTEAIDLTKAGIPSRYLDDLAERMGVSLEWVRSALGISSSTADRKRKAGAPLNQEQSERVLGLQRLIQRAHDIVQQSGDPDGFEAAKWAAEWLSEPVFALGGRRPADYMDSSEGQMLVMDLLGRMQSGAYS
jgi:putative toxin-antitoxin system antitoxin component (TIGR02293 family)